MKPTMPRAAGHRTFALAAGLVAVVASRALGGCTAILGISEPRDLDASRPVGAPSSDASELDATVEGGSGGADAPGGDQTVADAAPGDGGVADTSGDRNASADGPGPSEAGGPTCCSLADPLDDKSFDAWAPRGVARALPAFVELTPDQQAQAGGLFWPKAALPSDFDLAYDFSITKAADGGPAADGLAFVAMTSVAGECEAGANLCVMGESPGFGLVLRTFHTGAHEPPVPYVGLVDTSHALFGDAGPVFFDGGVVLLDGGIVTVVPSAAQDPPSWRTICIRVRSGRAVVKLDGKTILSGVPVTSLPSAHWGFVAGTGNASERNAVRQARATGSLVCGDAAACVEDGGLCGP